MADKQQKRKAHMKTYCERNCKKRIRAEKRLHHLQNHKTTLEQRREDSTQNWDIILEERRRNYAENRQVINDRVNNRCQRTLERHLKSAIFESPNFVYPVAHDLGTLNIECQHCKAVYFDDELKRMRYHNGKLPHLSIQNGSENFPIALKSLFIETDPKCNKFPEFIRQYNNPNAFASMSAKIEDIPGNKPYCFKISGEVYHRTSESIQIDTTLQPDSVPRPIHQPSYAELYVYDADTSIVIRMRNSANAKCLHDNMITIHAVLNDVSSYTSCYRKLLENL